eukprot:NODE_267_length_2533_cov_26.883624_g249_i0.p1 GENE.NODE_267_length_2533_cov_26.883624_g249_i0~~NODE_267_length_2533_cov_26.883624_g249_i0.p1  ORF type:complete len:586 (+),score=162.89 NODE_267_length_2533_cov_26.883624_g249_i0:624-2381(+)
MELKKIKTIGDAFWGATGLDHNDRHAINACAFLLCVFDRLAKQSALEGLLLRAGVHTGPAVAGVLGQLKWSYDVFGPAVEGAQKLEAGGQPGAVHISEATFEAVTLHFECTPSDPCTLANGVVLKTYYIVSQIKTDPVHTQIEFSADADSSSSDLGLKDPSADHLSKRADNQAFYAFRGSSLTLACPLSLVTLQLNLLLLILIIVPIDALPTGFFVALCAFPLWGLLLVAFHLQVAPRRLSFACYCVCFLNTLPLLLFPSTLLTYNSAVAWTVISMSAILAPASLCGVLPTAACIFVYHLSHVVLLVRVVGPFSGVRILLIDAIVFTVVVVLEHRLWRLAFIYHNRSLQQAQTLEAIHAENSQFLENIVPRVLLPSILSGELQHENVAHSLPEASVLFASFEGLATADLLNQPMLYVATLNQIVQAADGLLRTPTFECLEKIKIVGNVYMVAAGVPFPFPDHCLRLAQFALQLQATVRGINGNYFVHVGINTGPLVGMVVGTTKWCYDVFGDTVNTASRLMSASIRPHPMLLSAHAHSLFAPHALDGFRLEGPALTHMKGLGEQPVYGLVKIDQEEEEISEMVVD